MASASAATNGDPGGERDDAALPRLFPQSATDLPIVLVTLIGLGVAERNLAIARAIGQLSRRSERPVFITDDLDISSFVAGGHFYE